MRQVYLMDVTCDPPPGTCTPSGAHNITDGFAEEYSPTWSPDGARLAVAASINNALGRIMLRRKQIPVAWLMSRYSYAADSACA